MPNALFDPIINSEDEMLIRAHLQGRKYYASTEAVKNLVSTGKKSLLI